MATTTQSSEFARIHSNIEYLKSHFLNYTMYCTHDGDGIMCKYCGGSIVSHEECEVGTRETRESAKRNIEGAEILISKLSDMTEVEREKVLGFLNQCLRHHYM